MTNKGKFKSQTIFHIFNKSIANFGIFQNPDSAQRFIQVLDYYNNSNCKNKFSLALKNKQYSYQNLLFKKQDSVIRVINFCIMPDHYHLLARLLLNDVLSKYISDVENSFSRYFNFKYNRKGPLWQSRFRSVRIRTNEQLLHVSRYIHLNPTTDNLVKNPEDWPFSSYRDFITQKEFLRITTEISIREPSVYKKFVDDNKNYQRELKRIKKQILE